MQIININDAKNNLAAIIEQAVNGETFVIEHAGKPLVKVTAFEEGQPKHITRLGFLNNQIRVPDDFDKIGHEEIDYLFNGR